MKWVPRSLAHSTWPFPHKPISSFFSLTSLSLRSKPFFFFILELNVSLPFLLRRRQHGHLRKGAELGLNDTGDLLLCNGDAAFGSLKRKKTSSEGVETACSSRSRERVAALSSKRRAPHDSPRAPPWRRCWQRHPHGPSSGGHGIFAGELLVEDDAQGDHLVLIAYGLGLDGRWSPRFF